MPKPYSQDLRNRVIDAVERGADESPAQRARRYAISESVAIKWLERVERHGSREPVGHGGHRTSKLMAHRDFLEAVRAEKSDVTLQALCDRLLCERGVKSDTSMMSRFFRRLGVTFKKRRLSRASRTASDISRHRARWRAYQGLIDPRRLVFIDETWTKTNMTRLRGWSCRKASGSCRQGSAHGRWKTATFLAALRNDRIDAPCLFDGPINGERFRAYVEQFLVSDPQAGRRRHPRQPRLPHKAKGHTTSVIRDRRGAPRVSAQILPGPQSDRAGLRQVQDFAAKGRSPNIRRCRRRKRSHPRSIPARRMRRLCEKRRIRVKPNADRSSPRQEAITLETDLYPPIKIHLERLGLEVKGAAAILSPFPMAHPNSS